jgi:hypothetical protein
MKFRKKPVIVEALQFLPNTKATDAILALAAEGKRRVDIHVDAQNNYTMYIQTLEGKMEASIGDWIIRGVEGELYPCKPDIFMKTYEVVE